MLRSLFSLVTGLSVATNPVAASPAEPLPHARRRRECPAARRTRGRLTAGGRRRLERREALNQIFGGLRAAVCGAIHPVARFTSCSQLKAQPS
jgi:hypothetical protein